MTSCTTSPPFFVSTNCATRFYKLAELSVKAVIDSRLTQWISLKTVRWKTTSGQISLTRRNTAYLFITYRTDIYIVSINLSGALRTLPERSRKELASDKEVPRKDGVSTSGAGLFTFSKPTCDEDTRRRISSNVGIANCSVWIAGLTLPWYSPHIRTEPSVLGTQIMSVAQLLASTGLRTPSFSTRFSSSSTAKRRA